MPKEYELALRARDGDREALAQLVERIRIPLFQLAYADLRHYEDAQDAVAAALLQVCLHVGELRQPERIRAWMQSIVRNEIRRLRRGTGRATLSLDEAETPAASTEPSLLRLDIERALRRLPTEVAEAMRLFYLDDLPLDEVMRRTGRSKGTVASWLHRGRRQLASEMEGYTTMRPTAQNKAPRPRRARATAGEPIHSASLLVQTLVESEETVFDTISNPVSGWCMAEDERGNLWVGTAAGLLIIPASPEELPTLAALGRRTPALAHFAIDPRTHERRRLPVESAEWVLVGVEEGLPHPQVRAFQWDRTGRLWAGTDRGLACWDGATWRTFTRKDGLCHDEVHTLLIDREGALWVGTRRGLNRWDGAAWDAFTAENGLGGNFVWTLLQDSRGRIWAGTLDGGVSVREDGAWRVYRNGSGLTSDGVLALMEDSRGRVWIGQQETGISLFDPDGRPATPEGEYRQEIGGSIYCLMEDSRGRVWIPLGISRKSRVALLDLDLHPIQFESPGEIHHWNVATSLLEDRHGRIRIGTDEGLSVFDGHEWQVCTPEGTLTDSSVTSLVEDARGRIWMGTYTGVVCHDHGQWRSFTAEDGLRRPIVYCLLADSQGRLWAGTFGGLHAWDGVRWIVQDLPPEHSDGVTALMEDAAGRIWVGTEQGLGVPQEHGWSFVLRESVTEWGDSSVGMGALLQDRRGRVWIGTRTGLTVFEDGEWRLCPDLPGEMAGSVSGLLEDSHGRLWVGGAWGASAWDGRQWQVHRLVEAPDDPDRRPLSAPGRPGLAVRAFAEDAKGRIWAATDVGGVAVWDGQNWRRFGFAGGLSSLLVYALLIDREGRLWIGTFQGGVCLSTRPAAEL